ncbi:MAG: PEGA domain-containing protein [Planctomycetota bacterium]
MRHLNRNVLILMFFIAAMIISGCVERKLTINTNPQQALVILNDEEIGVSPVTVSFNWYGDYNIRINKAGYETLITHRELKAPLRDKFPFDFFAQILNPKKIVDEYEWSFELEPIQEPARDELIQAADTFKTRLSE